MDNINKTFEENSATNGNTHEYTIYDIMEAISPSKIKESESALLQKIISTGFDVNTKSTSNQTALIGLGIYYKGWKTSKHEGDIKVVDTMRTMFPMLLEAGANPHIRATCGNTIMSYIDDSAEDKEIKEALEIALKKHENYLATDTYKQEKNAADIVKALDINKAEVQMIHANLLTGNKYKNLFNRNIVTSTPLSFMIALITPPPLLTL